MQRPVTHTQKNLMQIYGMQVFADIELDFISQGTD